jgi:two-component system, NtrC family, response regulator AtoC
LSKRASILIVDDEPNIRRVLQVAFEKAGYLSSTADDAEQAFQMASEGSFDCVVTDVTMPGRSGYDLMLALKEAKPDLPVVIMTAFGTIPQAVQAIRNGAYEYIAKPFDLDVLKRIVASAVEAKPGAAPARAKAKPAKGVFIAESPAMKEVFETVRQVADSRATVLITGESGSGKEVVAKSLHELSSRSPRSFVAVSCAALPETLLESELFGYEKGAFTGAQGSKQGRFELAHTGTLFLDEIGEIPLSIQVKLLRVLQEREFERLGASKPTRVDVRLVTATNRELRHAVDEGTFRLDLLYRLQVVEIHVPPLRERVEDIVPLATHFLERFCRENGRPPLELSPEAIDILCRYSWPGNVRELENTMERASVLSANADQMLSTRLLPPAMLKAA